MLLLYRRISAGVGGPLRAAVPLYRATSSRSSSSRQRTVRSRQAASNSSLMVLKGAPNCFN